MLVGHDADCGRLYGERRRALIREVRALTEEQRSRLVPATPAWSVRDVVAHLVGIAADLNALRFGTGDPDAWTAAQVGSRRDRSVDELAAEWAREAPAFEEGLRRLGYAIGSHYVGDLLQHVADVHDALGRPGLPDDEALVVGLDFFLDTFHETLVAAGVGAVAATIGEMEATLGAGPVVASLTADRFEAFRALGGRRSAGQLRALAWDGDVDRVVGLVSPHPLPETDLVEGPSGPG